MKCPWRTGALGARQTQKAKNNRKSRGGLLAAWAIVIAVLAGGGAITWSRFEPTANPADDTKPVHNGAVPGASATAASPLGTTSSPPGSAGPPADPFAGTPAEGWAVGAAGIAVPKARPHGEYTAAQVRTAFQMTSKVLIAANLNWPTLRGGAPTAFADLLSSRQRSQFVAGLDKTGLDKRGAPLSTRILVTSFAPGSATFVSTMVKVHGSMTAGTAAVSGNPVLRIRFNYLFVYAVEPPGWCDVEDGYIHPAYPAGPPSKVRPSGAPVDPYSTVPPSGPRSTGCQRTTGT